MIQDAYGQLGRTVSEPPRRTAPRPLIPAGPPQQAPNQVVSDIASANNANANANRTRAITPEEIEALRLQNDERRRGLNQGISTEQVNQNTLSNTRAELESMSEQIGRVGNLYNQNFRDNDPMVSLGMSSDERQFDAAAGQLRQQAQGAFRNIGSGPVSDYDARLLEQAYGLTAQQWDVTNEEILDGMQRRLNQRRAAVGLPPSDWRQSPVPASNPNLVQPGESMGQVGSLPPPGPNARSQGTGSNQLDNAGGSYATEEDKRRAGDIASHLTALARAGASDDIMNGYLRELHIGPIPADQLRALNGYRRSRRTRDFPGFSPTVIPTGHSDPNLTTGAANTGYGAGVIAAGDAMTFGLLDNATADPERTRAGMELLREQHPVESAIGEGIASIVPGVGLERAAGMGVRALNGLRGGSNIARLPGGLATIGEGLQRPLGNAMYGAGYGAGSADEGNRFLGAARGAAMSAAGGEVGDRAMAGVGRAATGARNSSVRYLADRGIPLTVGQIAGGSRGIVGRTVAKVENALDSIPVLGDAIRARRAEGYQRFNQTAFDDALAPINTSTGGVIAEEGNDLARSATSRAYRQALNGVEVPLDNSFNREIAAAIGQGQRLPQDLQDHFTTFVRNRIAPIAANGRLTGTEFQALQQEIRQMVSASSGQLSEQPFSTAMKGLENSLERVIRRNAPDVVPALNRANRAFRHARVVEGAVGRAINNKERGGMFTPAQLGTEARGNAARYSSNAGTTRRPFYELQRSANDVLPPNLPNSGTADRTWILQTFPAIASGTLYQTGLIDQKTAALFATLGLPYTQRGQQAFQKLLVSRPDAVRRAGEAIISQRRWGGRVGAGAVNPLTDQTPSPMPR